MIKGWVALISLIGSMGYLLVAKEVGSLIGAFIATVIGIVAFIVILD